MKILFKKLNISNHELKIIRADNTTEHTTLDTNTYLLHDVCHYYVERELKTFDGFWGMLSQGFKIEQLSGKTNRLTEKLRIIEFIVGGTQSIYLKHMNESDFLDYVQTMGYDLINKDFIENVIPQITEFMNQWKYLPIGQAAILHFIKR